MMKQLLVYALMALLLGGLSAAGWSAAMPAIDIPYLDHITIDGRADDWGARGYRVEIMLPEAGVFRPQADCDPTFRLGWNRDGLLLYLRVRDNVIMEYENIDELWRLDCTEVFMATAPGAQERYQLDFATGADPRFPTVRSRLYDYRLNVKPAPLAVTIAGGKCEGGYAVELLLPWKNLKLAPKPGMTFGLQVATIDADKPGDFFRMLWFPRSDTAWNSSSMYTVCLANAPSDPVQAIVTGDYEPGKSTQLTCVLPAECAGQPITVTDGTHILAEGTAIPDANGRAGLPITVKPLARTEQYGTFVARIGKQPASIIQKCTLHEPLPPEADGIDIPQTIREIQARATTRLQTLPASPLRARHEGMVCYLCELLKDMKVVDGPTWRTYRARYTLLRTILDGLDAGVDVLAQQRGRFEWAFYSRADGSGQPIFIDLPPDYDGRTPLPLVIMLHGNGGNHNFPPRQAGAPRQIQIAVNGRGDPHYFGLGEIDTLEATDFMVAHFPVDPRRVSLVGASTGGWGVLRLASRHPDKFAGVVSCCAYAYGLELGNLSYTPVQEHHGTADWLCPIDDMRVSLGEMKKTAKYLSTYEYPGVGHDVWFPAQQQRPYDFMQAAIIEELPRNVLYTTDQLTRGRCRWVTITRFLDPHDSGTISLTAAHATLRGTTRNIAGLQLAKLPALFPKQRRLTLELDGQTLTLAPIPEQVQLACRDGRWAVVPLETPNVAQYQRGGLMNLFDGEPIVIVAPTGWQENAEEQALIEKCATSADFGWRKMPFGRIPVVAAETFDAKAFAGHLVLVGTPARNRVLAEMLPQLPVRVDGEQVTITGVGQYPLATTAISLTYRNPYASGRRVVWFSHETTDLCPYPPLLYTSYAFAVRADVIVHDRSGETPVLTAAANYGDDWTPPTTTVEKAPRLSPAITCTNDLEREVIGAAVRELHADFGVYYLRTGRMQTSPTLAGGRLSLSALQALIPSRMQTIVRARLTPEQMTDMLARTQGKPSLGWVAMEQPTPIKPYYDVIFLESAFDTIGCDLQYGFPKGSLTYTGLDAHNVLGAVCR